MRHLYHFYVSLKGQKLDLIQISQLLVVLEQKLVLIQHFKLQVFPFHFYFHTNLDQLKLNTYYLPCELNNRFKLLIIFPKIKALLEGGQHLYTKNATAQGRFFILRMDGYCTRENLVTRLPVGFYQYIAYLTTFH